MNRVFAIVYLVALSLTTTNAQTGQKSVVTVEWSDANHPLNEIVASGGRGPAVLRAQILLDRAGFSPGEIDAAYGPNLRAAIRGFQTAHQLVPADELGQETWTVLNMDAPEVLVEYTIASEDVAGPFKPIPADLIKQSLLDSLVYQSPLELLGEKFHVSPKLLTLLNPGKVFD